MRWREQDGESEMERVRGNKLGRESEGERVREREGKR